MELKSEDVIAIILLLGTFIAVYMGKATWEQALTILLLIVGVYFGVSVGYKRAQEVRK
jgi:TRAP-type C4-dicarboxylate transport system permease small subunit